MRKLPKIISQEEFEKLFSESKKKEASLKSKPMKKKMNCGLENENEKIN